MDVLQDAHPVRGGYGVELAGVRYSWILAICRGDTFVIRP